MTGRQSVLCPFPSVRASAHTGAETEARMARAGSAWSDLQVPERRDWGSLAPRWRPAGNPGLSGADGPSVRPLNRG